MTRIPSFILLLPIFASGQPGEAQLFIGTYTDRCESAGIYSYFFDTASGDATPWQESEPLANPSFLVFQDRYKTFYAVSEHGLKSKVYTLELDESGRPVKTGETDARGADPCYITADGKFAVTANYSGGSLSVFPVNADGALGDAVQVIAHKGSGPNAKRQEKAHVHMVQFTPDGDHLLANDLGTDKIYIYRYDPSKRKPLSPVGEILVKPGSGPRHIAFSPNGKSAYLLQELDGTLTVFSYHAGKLAQIQETSVVQKDFQGDTGAADIHVSLDGKFVYATNRGSADTISVFRILPDGKLEWVETTSVKGKGPRNFTLSPDGKFVLVANQNSDEVVIFSRDAASGRLTDTGKRIAVCSPVCLVFRPTE